MFKILVVAFMIVFGGCMEIVEEDNDSKELDLEFVKQNIILSADERTAFVNVGNFGVYIIDISDPEKPKLLKRYKTDASIRSIALNENILFCANDDKGVELLDVNDLSNIKKAGSVTIKDARTRSVKFNEDYSKLAVGTNKGVILFDMLNETSPKYAGKYEMNASVYDLKFYDNSKILFIANFKYGVNILNIEKFSFPRLLSSVALDSNSCDIEFDNNLPIAYVAILTSALKTIDITDIKNPYLKGGYDAHDVSMIWDIAVGKSSNKKRLYLAKAQAGFEIVDFTNPSNPHRVSFFDTNATVRAIAVNKAQTKVFIADGREGFKIFDISGKKDPEKIGSLSWFHYR